MKIKTPPKPDMRVFNTRIKPNFAPRIQAERDPRKQVGMITRRLPMKTVMMNGKKLRLYSLAWLAKLSGKSTRTFHRWEIEGIWPKPLIKLADGVRWYSAAEINGYSELVKASGIRRGSVKKGREKMSLWIKRNSFELQRLIRGVMEKKFADFPTQLPNEEATLKALAKSRHISLPHKQFMALITGEPL